MGYCIYHEEGNIKFKKENMKKILNKLSDYFNNGGELRWVNGFNIADIKDIDDVLGGIWEDLRYKIKGHGDYYIITDFIGDKLGDDDTLFKLIAPYCEDGYLQFCGEDGDHFRFVIENGNFKEKFAKIIFD